jgi:hypothetical protein
MIPKHTSRLLQEEARCARRPGNAQVLLDSSTWKFPFGKPSQFAVCAIAMNVYPIWFCFQHLATVHNQTYNNVIGEVESLGIKNGLRIMDIACGTGKLGEKVGANFERGGILQSPSSSNRRKHWGTYLIIDGGCERSDQNTSWRHFSSVDVAPRKRSCTFFYAWFIQKKALSMPVLQIFHTKNRWDIDNFACDAWYKFW